MPTANEIRAIVSNYIDMMCASDIDGIMALYADDCTAEDPVGGTVQEGAEAVRAFYSFAAPMLQAFCASRRTASTCTRSTSRVCHL